MPGNCSSQPFRAYTILLIHFSPLMWSCIVSSNVIIWILAETFEVYLGSPLSWAEPCRATEMGYYGYLRIATAFLLAGINYSVTPPWYPACCEPFAFRQNGSKITNICLTEITWRLFFSLLSNIAKSRLWYLLVFAALFLRPHLLCHWAPQSLCFPSLSTIHSSITA